MWKTSGREEGVRARRTGDVNLAHSCEIPGTSLGLSFLTCTCKRRVGAPPGLSLPFLGSRIWLVRVLHKTF